VVQPEPELTYVDLLDELRHIRAHLLVRVPAAHIRVVVECVRDWLKCQLYLDYLSQPDQRTEIRV